MQACVRKGVRATLVKNQSNLLSKIKQSRTQETLEGRIAALYTVTIVKGVKHTVSVRVRPVRPQTDLSHREILGGPQVGGSC